MREDIEFQDSVFNRFVRLIVTKGKSAHKEYYFLHNATVGRGEGNLIQINDSTVSTNHVKIGFTNGQFWIQDLESRNGTFINGKKITRQRLKPYDRIQLGSAEMVFLQFGEIAVEDVVDDTPAGDDAMPSGATIVVETASDRSSARALSRLEIYDRVIAALQEVPTGTSVRQAFEMLLNHVLKLIPAKRAVLLVQSGGGLRIVGGAGELEGMPIESLPLPRSVLRKVQETRGVVLSQSTEGEQRFSTGTVLSLGIKSLLAVPLLSRDTLVGVLYLDSLVDPKRYDETHCRDLLAAGRLIATYVASVTAGSDGRSAGAVPAVAGTSTGSSIFGEKPQKMVGIVLLASVRMVGDARPDLGSYISMLDLFYKRVQGTVLRYHGAVEWIVGSNLKAVFPVEEGPDATTMQAFRAATEIHRECFGLNLRARLSTGINLATRVCLEAGELTSGVIGTRENGHPVSMGRAASDASNILGRADSRETLIGPQAAQRWGASLNLGRQVSFSATDGVAEARSMLGVAADARPVGVPVTAAVEYLTGRLRRLDGSFTCPVLLVPNPQDPVAAILELPPETALPSMEKGETLQVELDLYPYTGEVSFSAELLDIGTLPSPEGRVYSLSLRLEVPSILPSA